MGGQHGSEKFDTTTLQSSSSPGVELRALSLDSLKEVTGCLLDMNQEVVKVILECEKDIGRSRELFELVGDYFDNSLRTLDFCTSLDKCLKHARDIHSMIVVALDQFEEEMKDHRVGGKYVKTLEELRKFKAAGDPFTEEFFAMFRSVYAHQMMMLGKLHLKKNKLDKKLKHINAWRMVSGIIFATTLASVSICSAVAVALAAPPVVAALAAAVILPLGSTGKWIDSLLKKYGRAMKGQKKLVSTMQVGTCVANKDLGSIRMLVGRLEMELGLIQKTGFAVDQGIVKLVIQEIKKEVGVLMKNVDDLRAQADNCSRDITTARTVILQRITKMHNDI